MNIKNNIENNTHKPYLSRLEAIKNKLDIDIYT